MKSHILWHLHKTNTFHKAGSLTICYGSFQGSHKLARTFRTFKPAAQGFFSGTVLYSAFSAVPQFFPHVKYPAQTPLRQQCLYKPCNSSRMGPWGNQFFPSSFSTAARHLLAAARFLLLAGAFVRQKPHPCAPDLQGVPFPIRPAPVSYTHLVSWRLCTAAKKL